MVAGADLCGADSAEAGSSIAGTIDAPEFGDGADPGCGGAGGGCVGAGVLVVGANEGAGGVVNSTGACSMLPHSGHFTTMPA